VLNSSDRQLPCKVWSDEMEGRTVCRKGMRVDQNAESWSGIGIGRLTLYVRQHVGERIWSADGIGDGVGKREMRPT